MDSAGFRPRSKTEIVIAGFNNELLCDEIHFYTSLPCSIIQHIFSIFNRSFCVLDSNYHFSRGYRHETDKCRYKTGYRHDGDQRGELSGKPYGALSRTGDFPRATPGS